MKDDEKPYHPPLPTRASRRFARRSKISARGFVFAQFPGTDRLRKITCESGLERSVLLLLLNCPDVVDIWEQPPRLRYTDLKGETAYHTFDFLITLTSGRKVALAVKPSREAQKSGFRAQVSHIAAQIPVGFADAVWLVTDLSFSRADCRAAELAYSLKHNQSHNSLQAENEQ